MTNSIRIQSTHAHAHPSSYRSRTARTAPAGNFLQLHSRVDSSSTPRNLPEYHPGDATMDDTPCDRLAASIKVSTPCVSCLSLSSGIARFYRHGPAPQGALSVEAMMFDPLTPRFEVHLQMSTRLLTVVGAIRIKYELPYTHKSARGTP